MVMMDIDLESRCIHAEYHSKFLMILQGAFLKLRLIEHLGSVFSGLLGDGDTTDHPGDFLHSLLTIQ